MESKKNKNSFEKPVVDEAFLMEAMSRDEAAAGKQNPKRQAEANEGRPKDKPKAIPQKKIDYEEVFLTNRYPSGRNGKVVYIRPAFHERLLRIVQLTREEKTTLYSYIDNILEHHFREFGSDITYFFNERNKPIF